MSRPGRGLACLAMIGATSLLVGCGSEAAFRVGVRDRGTHAPIEGAEVAVRSTGLLSLGAEPTSVGYTGSDGDAMLKASLRNRLQLTVMPPGRAEHRFVADHPAAGFYENDDSGWFGPSVDADGNRATVEIRVWR